MSGIYEAIRVGLIVKLNTVPVKNVNDNEIIELLEFGIKNDITIRFIEYMENSFASRSLVGLTGLEILNKIGEKYKFIDEGVELGSPSHYYKLENNYRFGIIEPHRDDFCSHCNRIRLTAEGDLIPCLYFDESKSIKSSIRNGNILEAKNILYEIIRDKPEKNRWSGDGESSNRAFYETGG